MGADRRIGKATDIAIGGKRTHAEAIGLALDEI